MQQQISHRTYRTVQILLIAPIVSMWGGVAYWFGFASQVILRTVFPELMAPFLFSALLLTALAWTLWHRGSVPRWRSDIRRTDLAICVFLVVSMILVIGQIMAI